jgi:hypothetical protein
MSVVDDMTSLQAERVKDIEALKAELDTSESAGSLSRRSIKTEGERVVAYALLREMERQAFGEVRTSKPSRHHV